MGAVLPREFLANCHCHGNPIWHHLQRAVGIGSRMCELSHLGRSLPVSAVMVLQSGTTIKGLLTGCWVYFSNLLSILQDRISTGQAVDYVLIYPIGTTNSLILLPSLKSYYCLIARISSCTTCWVVTCNLGTPQIFRHHKEFGHIAS